MNFSTTVTEQRHREAKSVKTFLTVSLIGSLAIHAGVLAYGLSNLLSVAPQKEEDRPIEITFVEPETQVTPKPPEPKKKERIIPVPIPKLQTPPEKVEKQEQVPRNEPTQARTVEQQKTVSTTPQATTAPQNFAPRTEQTTAAEPSTTVTTPSTNVLTGNTVDSSVAFEGSPTPRRSIGSQRTKRERVATGPTTPQPPTEIRRTHRESNGSGTGDGRAACKECDTAYPEQARRNGVEGRVEVAVDTDKEGNVTNVRIVRSSGNQDLDEATIRQAQEWKLKPSSKGRQNTRIATEYAIEGSERHRELQQQQSRQRQAAAVPPGRTRRQMETATNRTPSTSRSQVATSSKKPAATSTTTSTSRSRRSSQSRVATKKPSKSPSYIPRRQQSASGTPRRVRRSNVATGSTRTSTTSTRRKRRQNVAVNRNRVAPTTVRRSKPSATNNTRRVRRKRQLSAPPASN
jgi:TonB family protein